MSRESVFKKLYILLQEQDSSQSSFFSGWCEQITEANIQVVKLQNRTELLSMDSAAIESGLLLTNDVNSIKLTDVSYLILLDEQNRNQMLPEGAYCIETLDGIDHTYLNRIYQRGHGLPWDILETSRLRVREITVNDVETLEQLYADPEVTRYMESLFPLEKEIEYTKDYIRYVYGFYGYGMWIVEEKQSGHIIGRVGLESKEGFDGLELGFMLGKKYWHQGYAYEMCEAVLAYGQEEFEVFSYRAMVHPENESSLRLCERLGFRSNGMIDGYVEMLKTYKE